MGAFIQCVDQFLRNCVPPQEGETTLTEAFPDGDPWQIGKDLLKHHPSPRS
jgi:hypothetical protein